MTNFIDCNGRYQTCSTLALLHRSERIVRECIQKNFRVALRDPLAEVDLPEP